MMVILPTVAWMRILGYKFSSCSWKYIQMVGNWHICMPTIKLFHILTFEMVLLFMNQVVSFKIYFLHSSKKEDRGTGPYSSSLEDPLDDSDAFLRDVCPLSFFSLFLDFSLFLLDLCFSSSVVESDSDSLPLIYLRVLFDFCWDIKLGLVHYQDFIKRLYKICKDLKKCFSTNRHKINIS